MTAIADLRFGGFDSPPWGPPTAKRRGDELDYENGRDDLLTGPVRLDYLEHRRILHSARWDASAKPHTHPTAGHASHFVVTTATARLDAHTRVPLDLTRTCVTADGTLIGPARGRLWIEPLPGAVTPARCLEPSGAIQATCADPNGGTVLVALHDEASDHFHLDRYALRTGERLDHRPLCDAPHSLRVSPGGDVLVQYASAAELLDASGRPRHRARIAGRLVTMSPNRRVFAALSDAGVMLLECASRRRLGTVFHHARNVVDVRFNADASELVAYTRNGEVVRRVFATRR